MAGDESADLIAFITAHAPQRFQLAGPLEFEWVVRDLFQRDGYTCSPGDPHDEGFGYFLAEKDGYTMAVLPVLCVAGREPDRTVWARAEHLREVLSTDYVSVITTGDVKPETEKMARRAGIEAWDWRKLEVAIRELFFSGGEIPDAVAHPGANPGDEEAEPELRLAAKWEARAGVAPESFNLEIAVTNLSLRHRYLHFELPVIVDIRGRQWAAGEWAEGDFTAGTIYSGATIVTNALFHSGRIGDKPPGGRVMLSCHERISSPVTYHLSARLKGEACYAVTFCFGRESETYRQMTRFRDEMLVRHCIGRIFVASYYALSPRLIEATMQFPYLQKPFNALVRFAVKAILFLFPGFKN